jgi:very-short-patch-repair endonuclease
MIQKKNNIKKLSKLEETLALQIRALNLPKPEREYQFCSRKWRFDFAYPEHKIAIECEGGVGTGGRHTRREGFADDCFKYNTATINDWSVLRFTSDMIYSGIAVEMLIYFLKKKSSNHVAGTNKMI